MIGCGDLGGGALPAGVLLDNLLIMSFVMREPIVVLTNNLNSTVPADYGSITDQLLRLPGIFQTERTLGTRGQAGLGSGFLSHLRTSQAGGR